jgi:energy-converting hydrogenase Eha subunit C
LSLSLRGSYVPSSPPGLFYFAGGGTANAQTVTPSPVLATALYSGLSVCWLPTAANTTTTPTLAVNGLAATTITKRGATALAASDLTTTAVACVVYDGTEWQLQNPQTTSAAGVTSFTGDGTLSNNSASTGAVTFALANALAGSLWGNNTASATTPVYTSAPVLGVDGTTAGTIQLANSAASAHTIFRSGATTTNTIAGFATVPTTGDLVDCTTATTTCTLTDSGVLAANVVTATSAFAAGDIILQSNGANRILQGTALQFGSTNNTLNSTGRTTSLVFQSGNDGQGAAAGGNAVFRSADCTSAAQTVLCGSALFRASNNAYTGSTASGGMIFELAAGQSTGTTNTGLQGLELLVDSYAQSGTVTQWNLECFTGTAKTVSDCAASPVNIAGVALSKSGAIQVAVAEMYSDIPINASAAVTIGHTVCAGSTAGQVTDSGGTANCTVATQGVTIGTVVATSGTWTAFPDGTAFPTLSTTLPLVHLRTGFD